MNWTRIVTTTLAAGCLLYTGSASYWLAFDVDFSYDTPTDIGAASMPSSQLQGFSDPIGLCSATGSMAIAILNYGDNQSCNSNSIVVDTPDLMTE